MLTDLILFLIVSRATRRHLYGASHLSKICSFRLRQHLQPSKPEVENLPLLSDRYTFIISNEFTIVQISLIRQTFITKWKKAS
jgi:hypothetical protein